jgi:hypothetical protein
MKPQACPAAKTLRDFLKQRRNLICIDGLMSKSKPVHLGSKDYSA